MPFIQLPHGGAMINTDHVYKIIYKANHPGYQDHLSIHFANKDILTFEDEQATDVAKLLHEYITPILPPCTPRHGFAFHIKSDTCKHVGLHNAEVCTHVPELPAKVA